jgi:hypothetical protein
MNLKIKHSLDIPGWTFYPQHKLYKSLVQDLPKNPRILEIGCGWGRSTWAWLDALPSSSMYYVLDNFNLTSHWCYHSFYKKYKGNNNMMAKSIKRWAKSDTNQLEIFKQLISQHPNNKIIKKIWKLDSDDWIASDEFSNNWDLVYLDDRHTFEVMKKWLKLFSNVQIVCGDDYSIKFPGIIKAVDGYARKNNKFKEISKAANFFVIKNHLTNSSNSTIM